MVFVTVVLSSDEWLQVSQAANRNWPQEPLETEMSRNEACRRFCLIGVSKLSGTTGAQRKQLADEVRRVRSDGDESRFRGSLPRAD
jgi:hypothetical protein